MHHRHLNTTDWSLPAIDSCLEYGDLPDWRKLFALARQDRRLAADILHIARSHSIEGSSVLAESIVLDAWPDLAGVRSAG